MFLASAISALVPAYVCTFWPLYGPYRVEKLFDNVYIVVNHKNRDIKTQTYTKQAAELYCHTLNEDYLDSKY